LVKLAAIAVLLGACVADESVTAPTDHHEDVTDVELVDQHNDSQLCGMAAALPSTDICSLMCDPDAFEARLVDNGMKTGNCYQIRCTLSPEMSVTVGVCL
jgi:hypothetical protein